MFFVDLFSVVVFVDLKQPLLKWPFFNVDKIEDVNNSALQNWKIFDNS